MRRQKPQKSINKFAPERDESKCTKKRVNFTPSPFILLHARCQVTFSPPASTKTKKPFSVSACGSFCCLVGRGGFTDSHKTTRMELFLGQKAKLETERSELKGLLLRPPFNPAHLAAFFLVDAKIVFFPEEEEKKDIIAFTKNTKNVG